MLPMQYSTVLYMYIRNSLLGAGGLSKFLEEIALLVGLPAL